MRFLNVILAAFALLTLPACQDSQNSQDKVASDEPADKKPAVEADTNVSSPSKPSNPSASIQKLDPDAFTEIEWTDLMPKEDFEALSNPPAYLNEIEDGSPEDQISNQVSNAIASAADDRYQQALVSTKVVPEMDGKAIRIPGFIVPFEFDDNQKVTQFFLVPFFGACIHVPPPPPNQVIHVTSPEGIKAKELYNPFWISGVVKTVYTANELASATYSMELQYIEMYTEF